MLAAFCASITAIGITAATSISQLTSTFGIAVEEAKVKLDIATTTRVSTMAMEQSLYHLIVSKKPSEMRSAAIAAIKGASFLEESLQKLTIAMPKNQKVDYLNQLDHKVKPIRMQVITEGMHGDLPSATENLRNIGPLTLKIDSLSQEILKDGQEELLNVAKNNTSHGVHTIRVLSISIAVILIATIIVFISNLKLQTNQKSHIGQLQQINQKLENAQNQLVQSEKLASIGQLAAGIAHEINNPIGYVLSNFGTLEKHLTNCIGLMQLYIYAAEKYITDIEFRNWLISERTRIDFDYTRDDILTILRESREGVEQVRKIVLDLKYFSHTANHNEEWQQIDITRGLEATLNIVINQIKDHADVVKELEFLPKIQCLQSQLNQVFMNLLVNAAHAVEGRPRGTITIRTAATNEEIWIEVEDTGCGISQETLSHIYDPFFTTKPVGKGTGLGLSLSFGIVQKHNGRIDVRSNLGIGTCFRITLPIQQPDVSDA
ncbi:MAG: ATP-binding protein [Pseudomonadota bacterium]